MKLLGQIFIGLFLTTNCWGQKTTDIGNISKSVISFYQWYIWTTKDLRYPTLVRGTEGKNGMTKLETTDYFKQLDSLGVIGDDFIESEKKRFKPCADFLKTMSWTTFATGDNFPAEDECGFLYYYYWTGGHEPYDGVEVVDVKINGKSATVEANIFFGDNKTTGRRPIVYMNKEKGKWIISKIDKGW